ncbi:hydroxyethylthiazole kinase [Natronorubrum sp. JWXQ-INN-674]|uniref:Hydroxyethylthiazole kinase n=1 Tax=Natronorubrum halalkaliphilum TaxID=2691917 RepID=A0A6B0VMU6_9EURY|nr:hydroxyethylthiazole kinase [Natronorubrum halalkaliphilum]MXV62864.1 hydroxyethylthiazole kinase [Natronorubrum halalkaliphilum]
MSESLPTDTTGDDLANSLQAIADGSPLVQHLTNEVTMNDVANLTLHWDALPVMADSPGDAGEMANGASAILLNTGQVPEGKVEAMHEAAATAAERDIPVVLDPVGVGATPTREAVAEALLEDVEFSVIKGNYGEISALAGVEAEVKGVESIGEYEEIEDAARSLADSTGATVVASGVEDVVATGDEAVRLSAGHERLSEVVGTGCMLGATIAAFRGALEESTAAALHGALAFGIAGERAAELDHDGPASYRTNFHDTVAGLTPDDLAALDLADRIERVA